MKHLKLYNIHFRELLTAFTKRLKDEGKSDSHVESLSYHSKEFLYFLESRDTTDIKKITQGTIDDFFTYLQKRKNRRKDGGLSNAYLGKLRQGVLRLLEFSKGVELGQSGFYIQKFKKDDHPKQILTREEVQQLFNHTDHSINGIRNKAILSLLYGCGLRKGELYKLNVNDINFSKDTIRIQNSKTSYQRDVPITKTIKSNLEEYLYGVRELLLEEGSKELAFLLNYRGARMSLFGIQNKIKIIADHSNIKKPITCHRLRHAIATHLLGDFTIEEIALFLGHRSIDSSQIYTHYKYTKTPQ